MHAQKHQGVDKVSPSRAAFLSHFQQTSRVRESRVRGGAAIWPSSGAAAVSGGVRGRNLSRVARGVGGVGDDPAHDHGTCHVTLFYS